MKATTTFAVAAFAFAGAACSQAADTEATTEMSGTIEAQTVSTEDDTGSAFNLALPSSTETNQPSTSGFNLNLGGNTQQGGLMVGGGGLVDTSLGDDTGLVLDLGIDEETAPEEDDGIIRLEK